MAKKATMREATVKPDNGAPAAGSPATLRVMFTLTVADLRLVDLASLVDGLDRSQIVGRLIREGLGDYYAGRRDRATAEAE